MTLSQKTTHAEAGAYTYETILGDIKLTSQALRMQGFWFYTVWNEEGEVISKGRCNTKEQAKDAPREKALKMAGMWWTPKGNK